MPTSSVIGSNFYSVDLPLINQLRRRVDPSVWEWAESILEGWGALTGGDIARRAEVIDRNPPRLERFDKWGTVVDEVVHHPDAIASKKDLCEEGFVGFSWQDQVQSDPARRAAASVLTTAFSYMLDQSDTGMACACGMTGGVARVVEKFGSTQLVEDFLPRLTTNDFTRLVDGAMFMTERSGGSDLSGTQTTASKDGGHWLLDGEKWFCSNVDAKAILTLARPQGAQPGTKGLGLYLVPRDLDDGSRNPIRLRRLKNKLGTRSVPTGEVEFEDTLAYEVAGEEAGLKQMMEMVNFSRLGVATMGAGISRRCLMEAAHWAGERRAFGKRLIEHPMVAETLMKMQGDAEAAMLMCLEAASLIGLSDGQVASDEDLSLLRLVVPLTKIRATRIGINNAIEAVELLGGNGYIEDWPTARQLRDAQCHTIWEGTENINSLDVVRAIRTGGLGVLMARASRCVSRLSGPTGRTLSLALKEVEESAAQVAAFPEVHARRFANLLADVWATTLLAENAAERELLVCEVYTESHLSVPPDERRASPDWFPAVVGEATGIA